MISLASAASLLLSFSQAANALHSSTDLSYKELALGDGNHAVPPRFLSGARAPVTVPEVDNKGFWFANFSVGASPRLELLIDTGSADVYLGLNRYKPGKKSQNLHKQFQITFLTTNPDGSGSATLRGDLYKDKVATNGLSVPNQELGAQRTPKSRIFPHDGLIGFASVQSSAFGGRPWIHSLCDENKIDECRFGLAFRTNKRGTQAIGGVDNSKFKGQLSVAPTAAEWILNGDVAVNNKVFAKQQQIITDSGTTVVYGPLHTVRAIFKELGIQTVYYPGKTAYLRGFFPCDKPPTVGFGFPSTRDAASASGPVSKKSKIFNILGKAMAFKDNGNNNCTASLQGMQPAVLPNAWLVGQAFFQGHYVDHNIDDATMGFADLS